MTVRAGWAYILLVGLVLIGATALRIVDPFSLQALRLVAFDYYQRLEPQAYDPSLPVRIVDIDEESLARIGQWPWPRTIVADLLNRLLSEGAATVAFDILFAEPDQTSPEQLVKRLTPEEARLLAPLIAARQSHDAILAGTIANSPTVLATLLTNSATATPVPVKAGMAVAGDDPRPFIPAFAGSSNNLPALEEAAAGIGAINWIPDRDQVVRRLPLVFRVGDELVPTLVAEALRVAQGASTYILKASNASGETAFGEFDRAEPHQGGSPGDTDQRRRGSSHPVPPKQSVCLHSGLEGARRLGRSERTRRQDRLGGVQRGRAERSAGDAA